MLNGKKIPYYKGLFILLAAFVLYRMVNDTELISSFFRFFWSLTGFFIWGFAIAYLLNPMMCYLETRHRMPRLYSLPIVFTVFIGTIVFIFAVLIPIVVDNVRELIEYMPKFAVTAQEALQSFLERMGWAENLDIGSFFENGRIDITPQLENMLRVLWSEGDFGGIFNQMNVVGRIVYGIVFQAIQFTAGLFKLLFGIVLSIYMLKDKEIFARTVKRLVTALLPQEKAVYLLHMAATAHRIFSQYLIGKTLDSLIIGVLCYIGLLILRAPYPLLLSIIVGITNMIPYFGPFIGAIPAILITLFFNPIKALWVAIFILLLQQLDGLLIAPKILGDSVGLRPFWIIVAIILGGGLFGLLGMLLGVPIFAVLKVILDELVEKRLKEKQAY